MLNGKILLILALYIILGAIALFNFGFHDHHMNVNVGWKGIVNYASGKTFDENIEDTKAGLSQASQGLPSNKETNN